MATKLNYDAKSVLNIKFSANQKGYDPLEVDKVLDSIIQDYETLTSLINELTSTNEKQLDEVKKLKEKLDKTNLELASLKKQFDELKRKSKITDDNYQLITKVTAYERVLYRKGIDLKKALSDPDNC